MSEYWRPLEAAHAFLVQRGAHVDLKALSKAFDGAWIILTSDMDAVRSIAPREESLDRVAGAISEND